MNQQKVFAEAVKRWGIDTQLDMAFEEMAELTKALCKMKRLDYEKWGPESEEAKAVFANVAEEIADVDLMLRQLEYIFGITETEQLKAVKMKRLCGLLAFEEAEKP